MPERDGVDAARSARRAPDGRPQRRRARRSFPLENAAGRQSRAARRAGRRLHSDRGACAPPSPFLYERRIPDLARRRIANGGGTVREFESALFARASSRMTGGRVVSLLPNVNRRDKSCSESLDPLRAHHELVLLEARLERASIRGPP